VSSVENTDYRAQIIIGIINSQGAD